MDITAIHQWLSEAPTWTARLLFSVVAIVAVLLIKRLLLAFFRPPKEDLRGRFIMENTFSISSTVVILISLVFIWLQGFEPLLTIFGLVGAGLVISSKDLVMCFIGFFALLTRDHFRIGDRICVAGGVWGDVIGKGMLFFTLLEVDGQSTGRLIRVPNMVLFTHPVINSTRGFDAVWNEISLHVTLDSDWRTLKVIMAKAAEVWVEQSRMDLDKLEAKMEQSQVSFKVRRPGIYVALDNGTIQVTLRYLCATRQRRDSAHMITEAILTDLEAHDNIHVTTGP